MSVNDVSGQPIGRKLKDCLTVKRRWLTTNLRYVTSHRTMIFRQRRRQKLSPSAAVHAEARRRACFAAFRRQRSQRTLRVRLIAFHHEQELFELSPTERRCRHRNRDLSVFTSERGRGRPVALNQPSVRVDSLHKQRLLLTPWRRNFLLNFSTPCI